MSKQVLAQELVKHALNFSSYVAPYSAPKRLTGPVMNPGVSPASTLLQRRSAAMIQWGLALNAALWAVGIPVGALTLAFLQNKRLLQHDGPGFDLWVAVMLLWAAAVCWRYFPRRAKSLSRIAYVVLFLGSMILLVWIGVITAYLLVAYFHGE